MGQWGAGPVSQGLVHSDWRPQRFCPWTLHFPLDGTRARWLGRFSVVEASLSVWNMHRCGSLALTGLSQMRLYRVAEVWYHASIPAKWSVFEGCGQAVTNAVLPTNEEPTLSF